MSMHDVFSHIEANRDRFIARFLDYLKFPTISAQGIGIREGAQALAQVIRGVGLEAQIIETAFNPVVLGRLGQDASLPTVMLYGHYDVQPPEPLEDWTTPPFEPAIRNRRIYARGAGDNKGQHFAQLMAVESLLAMRKKLPCNIIVMVDGEEEVGSPGLPGFVEKNRELLKSADLVVTADGSMHPSGRPIIQFGVRGLANFELRARGANRDLHSGNYGNVAPNPLWTLVHLLASMKNAAGEILIEGFHDRILPPGQAELEAAALLPIDVPGLMAGLGLNQLDAPQDLPYFHRLMFRPTLTINGIHGGYGGPGMKTVLPSEAVAKCDIRLIDAQDPEEILRLVGAHVQRHAPDVEFIAKPMMKPSRTPMDSRFAKPLQQAILEARGVTPLLYPCVGGSLPDAVFSKGLGIPVFLIPYANHDQANHAPNENIEIDCFVAGIRTGAALLTHLGRMGTDERPN